MRTLAEAQEEIKRLTAYNDQIIDWHAHLIEENHVLNVLNNTLRARLTTMATENKEALVNVPETNPTDQENS